jgi:hypothetical protein
MKTLEGMGLELFNKFCLKETGKVGSWSHLSDDRKLEWMKEALIMANYFYKEVLANIKPLPTNQKIETVYASGYADGQRQQHIYMLELFENQYQKLLDEYSNFSDTLKDSTSND